MMAGWLRKNARPMLDTPAFGIAGGIDDATQPGEGYRRCAHWTGFQRDEEIGIGQALFAPRQGSPANHQHFGMCGRILPLFDAVMIGRKDLAGRAIDQNSPYRHFIAIRRPDGLREGQAHIIVIAIHKRIETKLGPPVKRSRACAVPPSPGNAADFPV